MHKLEQKLHIGQQQPAGTQPQTTGVTSMTSPMTTTSTLPTTGTGVPSTMPTTGTGVPTGTTYGSTTSTSGYGVPTGAGTGTAGGIPQGTTTTPLKQPYMSTTTPTTTGTTGGGILHWDQINIAEIKTLQQFDRTVQMQYGRTEIFTLGGVGVAVSYLQPGWHFSEHGAPVVGTPLCQKRHAFFVLRGTVKALTPEGKEIFFGPNTFGALLPGHDAWVQGTEEVMLIDWAVELQSSQQQGTGITGQFQGPKVAPTVQ